MSHRLQDPEHILTRRTLRERFVAVAVTVLALNATFLVIVLVGWLAGWFHVSAGRSETDSRWRFQLTLNPSEVTDDLRETAATLKVATEVNTVIGDVVRYDVQSNRITIQTAKGQQVTARINDVTKIQNRGRGASPPGLQAGDRIELVFHEQDGQNHAIQISLLEGN